MGIGNQILFFLAGLGVFNGLLLVIYFLFIHKPKRWVNILFGLLMLMLCIRIGKSLFHIFMEVDLIYRQLGLSACIMIGPLLYVYIRTFLLKKIKPTYSDKLHLVVPVTVIIFVGIIWPYQGNFDMWNYRVVPAIYGLWAVYEVAAALLVYPLIINLFKGKTTVHERWILLVFGCVSVLCVAYISAYFGFPYLSGPLLFSLILYLLIGFLVRKENRDMIMLKEQLKYRNQKLSDSDADDMLNRLNQVMETQQLYLNPKLKLGDIARAIDSKPHDVSQVINDRMQLSYNAFINGFRVEHACILLKQSDHLTIEGIGQEVGFNSRSSFYNAFKSTMKMTPAQYQKSGLPKSI